MKFIVYLLFFVPFFAWPGFQDDYTRLLNGDEEIYVLEDRIHLSRTHFVFAGGFTNELGRARYFRENERVLREAGATDVSRLFASSFKSVDETLPWYRKELLRLWEKGGRKPLVLMGHSKGGVEVLAAVLKYPELIEQGVVERVVAMEAPLRRVVSGDHGNLLPKLPGISGLRSLTSEEVERAIRGRILELKKENPRLAAEISGRVFYLISKQDPKIQGPLLRPVGIFLEKQFHLKNDGLVALSEQHIPGFGRTLAELDANHLELFVADPKMANLTHPRKPKAATLALAHQVLKEELDPIPVGSVSVLKAPPRLGPIQTCAALFSAFFHRE